MQLIEEEWVREEETEFVCLFVCLFFLESNSSKAFRLEFMLNYLNGMSVS